MQITLIAIGRTDSADLERLMEVYSKRLKHYIRFEIHLIPDLRNAKHISQAQQREREGELLLARLQPTDHLILLDEAGTAYSSLEFASFLQEKMNRSVKHLILAIGGPYGFSEAVYAKSHGKISMSKMTFSHQMVRLFVLEQLYRGFTILRNEPYHHQ